jgi:hypothetical protein
MRCGHFETLRQPKYEKGVDNTSNLLFQNEVWRRWSGSNWADQGLGALKLKTTWTVQVMWVKIQVLLHELAGKASYHVIQTLSIMIVHVVFQSQDIFEFLEGSKDS